MLGSLSGIEIPEPTPTPLSTKGGQAINWRDELTWADATNSQRKMASFRGAVFFVDSSGTSFGRRNIVHQYPKKNVPYIEDMGPDTDEFSIEGYVVQHSENNYNYFQERNALIEALRQEGSGQLRHPFFGVLDVSVVGKVQMQETFRQGGIARFSMTFVRAEADTIPFPKATIDYVEAVDQAVERSLQDGVDAYAEVYNPDDFPGFSLASVTTSIGKLNTMMRSAMSSIQGLGPAQLSKALATMTKEYTGIDTTVINDACSLGSSIIGMFNGLLSLSGMYGDILIEQMFGPCSTFVRGINSGPMSGAQSTVTQTSGFQGSTLSDPAIVAEDFGKTATRASLAITGYGEATGGSNISQYGGALDTIPITTVSRAQQSANQVAIVNLARLNAITTASRTAIRIEYTSHNSVVEIMQEVVDVIDAQLLKLGNDAADTTYADFGIKVSDPNNYQALQSLRPEFIKAMLGIGAQLADLIDYKVPTDTISSLVLSYDKYESLDREIEIISRNIPLIKHPGFLPGGRTLEILNI